MEDDLIKDYKKGLDIYSICAKYHIGKLKVKKILADNNIELRKRGGQPKNKVYVISDWKIEKYPEEEGFVYAAIDKNNGVKFYDHKNQGGFLTSHIKNTYGVEIPTLYDRREYYKETGNYWWEQWFDIVKEEKKPTKKCPYCDWETTDVENKSGAFEVHLKEIHDISKFQYIKKFPDEKDYFRLVSPLLNRQMEEDSKKFVTCKICGKKLAVIDNRHLSTHGIRKLEYIRKYGIEDIICNETYERLKENAIEINSKLENSYESKGEKEIKEYIISKGFECNKNRSLLNGEELDIYIPSKNIAIEYNGVYWHQEKYGKGKFYHVSKLERCNNKGIKLLHIFEDEYELHKDIVLSKINHILGLNNGEKIMARKCQIQEIDRESAKLFLNSNHIQGYCRSTIYFGAIYERRLVGVMCFKKTEYENKWELTRFATLRNTICLGLGGKMFKYFVKKVNPLEVKSFADRRWTLDCNDNLYIKLGFCLEKILSPEYRYYNVKVDKYTRFHKFNFRKHLLHKRYGLSLNKSELEMAKELGYDRIWDCGLFKYVWKKEEC